MDAINTTLTWLIRIAVTALILMLAAYVGLDLLSEHIEANYIVIEK